MTTTNTTTHVSATELLENFYQRQIRAYDLRQQAIESSAHAVDQQGTCGTRFAKTTCDAVKRCAWTDTRAKPWKLFQWLGMSAERTQDREDTGVCRLSDAWLNRLFEELDAFGGQEFYSLVQQQQQQHRNRIRVDSVLYPFGMHAAGYRRVLQNSELGLRLECGPDSEASVQWLEIQQFTLPELSRTDVVGVLHELELERAMSVANGTPSRLAADEWFDLSPSATIWTCDVGSQLAMIYFLGCFKRFAPAILHGQRLVAVQTTLLAPGVPFVAKLRLVRSLCAKEDVDVVVSETETASRILSRSGNRTNTTVKRFTQTLTWLLLVSSAPLLSAAGAQLATDKTTHLADVHALFSRGTVHQMIDSDAFRSGVMMDEALRVAEHHLRESAGKLKWDTPLFSVPLLAHLRIPEAIGAITTTKPPTLALSTSYESSSSSSTNFDLTAQDFGHFGAYDHRLSEMGDSEKLDDELSRLSQHNVLTFIKQRNEILFLKQKSTTTTTITTNDTAVVSASSTRAYENLIVATDVSTEVRLANLLVKAHVNNTRLVFQTLYALEKSTAQRAHDAGTIATPHAMRGLIARDFIPQMVRAMLALDYDVQTLRFYLERTEQVVLSVQRLKERVGKLVRLFRTRDGQTNVLQDNAPGVYKFFLWLEDHTGGDLSSAQLRIKARPELDARMKHAIQVITDLYSEVTGRMLAPDELPHSHDFFDASGSLESSGSLLADVIHNSNGRGDQYKGEHAAMALVDSSFRSALELELKKDDNEQQQQQLNLDAAAETFSNWFLFSYTLAKNAELSYTYDNQDTHDRFAHDLLRTVKVSRGESRNKILALALPHIRLVAMAAQRELHPTKGAVADLAQEHGDAIKWFGIFNAQWLVGGVATLVAALGGAAAKILWPRLFAIAQPSVALAATTAIAPEQRRQERQRQKDADASLILLERSRIKDPGLYEWIELAQTIAVKQRFMDHWNDKPTHGQSILKQLWPTGSSKVVLCQLSSDGYGNYTAFPVNAPAGEYLMYRNEPIKLLFGEDQLLEGRDFSKVSGGSPTITKLQKVYDGRIVSMVREKTRMSGHGTRL
jgi:hypothetical protein